MKITNAKYKNLNLALEDDRGDNFIVDVIVSSVLGIAPSFLYYKNFVIALLIYLGVRFLYYFISEALFSRTLGKLSTQTKVVNINNEKPNLLQILIRSLSRFISLLSGVSDDEVAIHDAFSKTFVVKDSSLKRVNTKSMLYLLIQLAMVSYFVYYIIDSETDWSFEFILLIIPIFWITLFVLVIIIKKLNSSHRNKF